MKPFQFRREGQPTPPRDGRMAVKNAKAQLALMLAYATGEKLASFTVPELQRRYRVSAAEAKRQLAAAIAGRARHG